jgi:hypothetical protein
MSLHRPAGRCSFHCKQSNTKTMCNLVFDLPGLPAGAFETCQGGSLTVTC